MSRGSKMLMVVGIIMIVFGAIAALIVILAILGLLSAKAQGQTEALLAAAELSSMTQLMISYVFTALSSVTMLIAGIVGVINWNRLEKAKTCMIWGIICIAISLLGNVILPPFIGQKIQILSVAIGLVLPVLYFIGAKKNAD